MRYWKQILFFLITTSLLLFWMPALSFPSSWSLIPPLLTIVLAFFTQKIFLSLFLGIVFGALLLGAQSQTHSVLIQSISIFGTFFQKVFTDFTNFQILGFVLSIFMLTHLLYRSGSLGQLLSSIQRYVRSRKQAQLVTVISGIFIFFDDYANSMLVGTTMRPLTDRFRISREKLAFLVDATSAPVAGVAILSTWIGYEVGLLEPLSEKLHLLKNGYEIFFDLLSARYYCFFMLAFVFLHIFLDRDFGPMAKAEKIAISNPKKDLPTHPSPSTKPIPGWISLVSLASILTVFLIFLWIDGGGEVLFLQTGIWTLFSLQTWKTLLSQSQNSLFYLFCSGLFGWILGVGFLLKTKLSFSKVVQFSFQGLRMSMLPLTILILAWALKNLCDMLQTAAFLTHALENFSSPKLFPLFVFFFASLTSFATGTSWGTMAILLPLIGPIAYSLSGNHYSHMMILSLAAVLDGAIFGDHCSPISDTTILSSTASQCEHIAHVRTQFPYSIFVAISALFLGYLPASYGISFLWNLSFFCIWVTLFLYLFGKSFRQEKELQSVFSTSF